MIVYTTTLDCSNIPWKMSQMYQFDTTQIPDSESLKSLYESTEQLDFHAIHSFVFKNQRNIQFFSDSTEKLEMFLAGMDYTFSLMSTDPFEDLKGEEIVK